MKTELSFNVTKGLFPEKTSLRKRKTPKQNICFIVSPLVIALGAFQEAGQSLRFAHPMFSLRRFCVNANAETKHLFYCFPLGNRLRRFPRSRSKPALCPPYVFFTPSSRKRKTPKQNICFIVSPLVIAFGAFQEAGQSLRFAHPMFSLRRLRVNAKRRNKTFVKQIA